MTELHKKKLSEAMKKAYAEGRLVGVFKSGDENIAKRFDIRKKLSEKATGRKMGKPSEELIRKRAEGIRRARIANGNFSGSGHPNYRDGKAPLRKRMYNTRYYKDWRRTVFERDNYTCQGCGQVGGKLHADHVKPFAYYPELRFELTNGRTLCIDCHRKTDTYGYHTKMFFQPEQ